MASPHVPADMMQPAGMLTLSLFPNYSDQTALNEFLEGLLAAGYENASDLDEQDEKDGAALAFAYYRAYDAIYQRLLNSPSTASIDGEASRQFLWSQIEAFQKLSDRYKGEYDAFFDASGEGISAHESAPAVKNKFVF